MQWIPLMTEGWRSVDVNLKLSCGCLFLIRTHWKYFFFRISYPKTHSHQYNEPWLNHRLQVLDILSFGWSYREWVICQSNFEPYQKSSVEAMDLDLLRVDYLPLNVCFPHMLKTDRNYLAELWSAAIWLELFKPGLKGRVLFFIVELSCYMCLHVCVIRTQSAIL